jgi:hypothetical protein
MVERRDVYARPCSLELGLTEVWVGSFCHHALSGRKGSNAPSSARGLEERINLKGVVMFTIEDTSNALQAAGIDISGEGYGLEEVRAGMNVELEHGTRFEDLDVTGDDPVITVKIALAHLREFPDYYERLDAMEREADAAWALAQDNDPGVI